MKKVITQHTGFSLASITSNKAITTAYISVDLHDTPTPKGVAVEYIYPEALMAGAGKYTRAEFLGALSILGAFVSVTITDGVFTVYIRSTSAVFPKVLSIVETMLKSPTFEQKELKRIKQTLTNVLKERKEESKIIAHEQLRNQLYGASDRRYSYSEDTLISLFPGVTSRQLAELHRKIHSLPWVCSIAGNTADQRVFEKMLTAIHKGANKKELPMAIHQQKSPQPGLVLKDIPSRQNIDFSIGAPVAITFQHPDFPALVFAIAVLGKWGGFAGRLMSTVRELEGLTYGIYARAETFFSDEQGYWRIGTFFSPLQAVQGLTSTFREVKKMYEDGITPEEFTRFKEILLTTDSLKNDSTASLLGELHSYHLQGLSIKEIDEHKRRMQTVSLAEVQAAIKQYLNPAWLTISGAGPIASVKKPLQEFVANIK